MNELGDFLRKLRGNLSLRDVQEGTGISHTYLSTLEKGYDPRTKKQRKPTPEVLQKLANYYKVNYRDLMFLAGYLDVAINESSTYENKIRTTKENVLKLKELEDFADKIKKTPKKLENKVPEFLHEQRVNKQKNIDNELIDIFVLLSRSTNLYYKNRLLTNVEKEKIITLLKTFFE